MSYRSKGKPRKRLMERRFHDACLPVILAAAGIFGLSLFSCTNPSLDPDDQYLIRVRELVVTVGDFNKAFDIAKSAYPHEFPKNSALFQEAQASLLNQMIEELLVLQRAAELQIVLTQPEVSQAIARIKADYPEGVFEQMLLEYAVSYSFWEKRLRTRLLMEKVVEREVHQNIRLTPEEIAKFYKEKYAGKHPVPEKEAEKANINELIVRQLRRQKAEEAYQLWVKDLRAKYTVDINQSQWTRLTGL